MSECLFCKIASGEIPGDIVYQDDEVVAFRDINPQAPTHILIIPVKHIETVASLQDEDAELIGRLVGKARDIAKQENLEEGGYRLVINNGAGAGQTVYHIHIHLLGGRSFQWPPG